jgi:beta-glucanase (GH16 family)
MVNRVLGAVKKNVYVFIFSIFYFTTVPKHLYSGSGDISRGFPAVPPERFMKTGDLMNKISALCTRFAQSGLIAMAGLGLCAACSHTPLLSLGSPAANTPSASGAASNTDDPATDTTDPWARQTGWNLVWHDEFAGPVLDSAKWQHETGTGNNGWGNNELEYYQAANSDFQVVDGASSLVITARKESVGGRAYTSSRLKTQGLASWTYGRIEARLKLPYGQGLWPAFWMLGNSIAGTKWPDCGEIDIMEMVGGTQAGKSDYASYGTIHWFNEKIADHDSKGDKAVSSGRLADAFHIYGVEWNSQSITWYLDGQLFASQLLTDSDRSELKQPFFILLNLAVGGDWPGSPDGTSVFPQTMAVDWVRVYQQ